MNLLHIIRNNRELIRKDLLSGMTVALALIPEAIAFAFVAGVDPLLSLQTAIVIGLVAAIFSGRPGMISSSTAAIAIVMAPLIKDHGEEFLFATVILMGIIQVLMGAFRLGRYTRIIPYPVVLGFLNGLAIVIFLSQWDLFKTDDGWLKINDFLIMLGFVGASMAIIHFFPKVTKAVPSSLVAIGSVTLVSIMLNYWEIYSLTTVADFAGEKIKGELPDFYIPNFDIT